MCFAIPLRVVSVNHHEALLEGDKRVLIGHEYTVHPGDYVRVTGDMVVDVLSSDQGKRIRRLIKELNTYE